MTDYREEQKSELETLRCIYTTEELCELSDDPYCFEVTVSSGVLNAFLKVQFMLPETYPDAVPQITISSQCGLTDEQIEDIKALLNQLAAENISTVMVFTLISAIQEKLLEYEKVASESLEREKKEKEEQNKKREEALYHGTTVTVETFLTWRKKFEEEFALLSVKVSQDPSIIKLTGRQMFEKDASLALSDARFLNEADEDLVITDENVEPEQTVVDVDESLFQDLDDLAIEDD